MSHPDEGTIQMLLDGELDPAERRRVEGHLAGCASCAARLTEARTILEEADRLVEVLAVPQRAAAPRASSRRAAAVRTLAWAASIVFAVGIGYWGRGAEAPTQTTLARQELDTPTASDASAPVVDATPTAAGAPGNQPGRTATEAADKPREAKTVDRRAANEAERQAPAASPPAPPSTLQAEAAAPAPTGLSVRGGRLADESVAAWRVVSMEEAVRVLDGQIRLIDGLSPDRVETGPGTAVAGADPSLSVVRVVYEGGAVFLDQQRPAATAELRRESAAKAARSDAGGTAPAWQGISGIRFVVTGTISPDSLRELGARVR